MNVVRILKLSVLTSLMSKGTGILFQIAAIPLALAALGTDGFALFMIYTGLTTWVGLCATGVAPSLTARVAGGIDAKTTAQYYINAAFFISAVILCIGLPLFTAALAVIDSMADSVRYGELLTVYFFVALLIVSSVVDSVNAGRNQLHITNLFFSLGSLLNLALMFIATDLLENKSPFFVFIMSQTGLVIARILNSVYLLSKLECDRSSLRIDKNMLKELRSNFGSFFFIQLSVAVSQQAIVLFTYGQSKELSAALSVIYRIYALIGSLLTMVSQPLWPMIIRARTAGNSLVLRLWYQRLIAYNLFASLVFGIAIYLFREGLNQYWLKGQLVLADLEYAAFLANYMLIALGQVNITFLMGYEKFSLIAAMLSIEALVLVVLLGLYSSLSELSVTAVIAVSATAFLLTSCWIGFMHVRQQLRSAH